ncbi:MAG: hypothetical protein SFU99_01140 [Saprospiraceae bacterium]|nr:hypothetical protein [Saprospiraceae bacterium]
MISLGNIFRNYTGLLRRFKLSYVLNNLLNQKHLQHNIKLYKKFGLNKSIYAPIGSQDFPNPSEDIPWLDKPNAKERLFASKKFEQFPKEIREELFRFVDDGYMILKDFFNEDSINQLNTDIDNLLNKQQVGFNYTGRKIMESYKHSKTANQFFRTRVYWNC